MAQLKWWVCGAVMSGLRLACCACLVLLATRAAAVSPVAFRVGAGSDDRLGHAVASGARFSGPAAGAHSFVYSSAGRVRVENGLDPILELQPAPGASTAWGRSVAVARNFRGDGFDAVAVGDPGYAQGTGRVSVYFGGQSSDGQSDLELIGVETGESHGWVVIGVRDMNGDGRGELAIGGPDAASGAGVVRLYAGAATPSAEPIVTLHGSVAGGQAGYALASCGGLDGDAFGDLAIGMPGVGGGAGAVAVLRGGAVVDSVLDRIIPSPTSAAYAESPRFGSSLASDADLDGDGLADLMVGASGWSGRRGRVYGYAGTPGQPSAPRFVLEGAQAGEAFGATVAMDTLESNSTADLVVASPGAFADAGVVRIYRGGAAIPSAPSTVFDGVGHDSHLGGGLTIARLARSSSVRKLYLSAPERDVLQRNEGVLYSYTPGVVLAVMQRPVRVRVGGVGVGDGAFLEPRPVLDVELEGSANLDPVASQLLIDGHPVDPGTVEWLGSTGEPVDVAAQATALRLRPSLAAGTHALEGRLVSGDGQSAGSLKLALQVTDALQLLRGATWPQPSRGVVHLSFTMTRPGRYSVDWYDVQGRMVARQGPWVVPSGIQDVEFDPARRAAGPGILHYVVRADHGAERASLKGRVVVVR